MRRLALAACLPLVGLSACNKKDDPPPVVLDDKKPGDPPPVKPAAAESKTLDLTPYGVRASIDVPADATAERDRDGIEIAASAGFAVRIEPRKTDVAALKKRFDARFGGKAKYSLDEADALVLTATGTAAGEKPVTLVSVGFAVGGVHYTASSPNGAELTDEAARRVVAAVRGIRQTDEMKQADIKGKACAERLRKGDGCRLFDRADGGLGLHVAGDKATEADVADLDTLLGIRTVTLNAPHKAPPAVVAKVAAVPGVDELILQGVPGLSAGQLAPFGAMAFVRSVELADARPDDDAFAVLAKLPELQRLTVATGGGSRAKVPGFGAGLAALKGAKKLEAVRIARYPIADAGLDGLGEVKSLQVVELIDAGVGDGVAGLRGAKKLRALAVVGGTVTDAGLQTLAGLTHLESLAFVNCPLYGTGFAAYDENPKLASLTLDGTKLSDAGLKVIAGLPVERLRAAGTNVGDKGLVHLAAMKKLATLDIGGTRVTDASMKALAALPELDRPEPVGDDGDDACRPGGRAEAGRTGPI